MVDLVLLQSVSYIAGAIGVCIAAISYATNVWLSRRNQELTLKAQELSTETRKAQIFMNLYEKISSQEMNWIISSVNQYVRNYPGYGEFYEKHVAINSEFYQEFISAASYFNGLGILMSKGFVDEDMVEEFMANRLPVIWKGFSILMRDYAEWYVDRNRDVLTGKYRMWSGFYYLMDEMKRRGAATNS